MGTCPPDPVDIRKWTRNSSNCSGSKCGEWRFLSIWSEVNYIIALILVTPHAIIADDLTDLIILVKDFILTEETIYLLRYAIH